MLAYYDYCASAGAALAGLIDHTQLKPEASKAQVRLKIAGERYTGSSMNHRPRRSSSSARKLKNSRHAGVLDDLRSTCVCLSFVLRCGGGEEHFEIACSVCVNPCWIPLCAQLLKGSGVKVCTVIGFPLGANDPEVKAYEAGKAVENGADEVDMVFGC